MVAGCAISSVAEANALRGLIDPRTGSRVRGSSHSYFREYLLALSARSTEATRSERPHRSHVVIGRCVDESSTTCRRSIVLWPGLSHTNWTCPEQ